MASLTPPLGLNSVFQQEFDFKTKYGVDLSDEQVVQLKKVFAIANLDYSGIIGSRQFADLMSLLGIDETKEELETMLLKMDENGDGQIEFEGEFHARPPHTRPFCAAGVSIAAPAPSRQ
jgi:Ca2+-binding EF-hand superfamily protein